MKSFLAVTLCLTAVASVAHAMVDMGRCPEFHNMEDFTLDPLFLGRWYEVQHYLHPYEFFTCNTLDVLHDSKSNDDAVAMVNTATNLDESHFTITGNGTQTEVPGQLSMKYAGYGTLEYNVLDTNYHDYAVVYSCKQDGAQRIQLAWIYSRTPRLPTPYTLISEAVLEENGIPSYDLVHTKQGGNCVYLPKP